MATTSLDQTLTATNALIARLRETLGDEAAIASPVEKSINPLTLAGTASALIKAQTTKLTLLALNKPFTPSSISQILSSISNSPLPAVVTAVQLCDPCIFSKFARHELRTKTARLLKAYENLLVEIPRNAGELEAKLLSTKAQTTGKNEQKAALIGTGLVWEVCDEVTYFVEHGLGEMAGEKMSNYRALFNDAHLELTEWLEDGRDGAELETELHELTLTDSASDSGSNASFSSRPTKETIVVAEWALDVLNHISMLYPPSIKRRLKRFPRLDGKTSLEQAASLAVARLDDLLDAGKFWTEQIDLVAERLFENDTEAAKLEVDNLLFAAKNEADAIRLAWDGSEDEFSAWIVQWKNKLEGIYNSNKQPP